MLRSHLFRLLFLAGLSSAAYSLLAEPAHAVPYCGNEVCETISSCHWRSDWRCEIHDTGDEIFCVARSC